MVVIICKAGGKNESPHARSDVGLARSPNLAPLAATRKSSQPKQPLESLDCDTVERKPGSHNGL
jgi:hypothetical protein